MDTHSEFTTHDWDIYARYYDALLALKPYQDLLRSVSAALKVSCNNQVLDAGCGTGNLLKLLSQKTEPAELCGIDFSESMLKRASGKKYETDVEIKQVDLNTQLPFVDYSFNRIASSNVLYALPSPQAALQELYRILSPSGRLVLVTPKKDYDNGLILKAHCESDKPDSYWANPHTSVKREKKLISEAMQDPKIVRKMLYVAKHNRAIVRTTAFTFFEEAELHTLLEECGFVIQSSGRVYAEQCFLISANKRSI